MVDRVSIKICGINDSDAAKACKDVDYVGLVFYQKSSRFVTAFQAKKFLSFFKKFKKLAFLLILILILSSI